MTRAAVAIGCRRTGRPVERPGSRPGHRRRASARPPSGRAPWGLCQLIRTLTGRGPEEVGAFTAQAPVKPVPLRALALGEAPPGTD
ncbi:hypothetical protein KBX06_21930 [Micromonospora sp. C31]|uniref:hypothetical protein n=1 Tax=Micromonospora sp. C31 TaxID=2824876 RepID=UPI001B382839|nr:hypothetical protein [Micromonospora sp. C31]MBQ1075797.1 hypothetical protein [Micromonospora sp. C31]